MNVSSKRPFADLLLGLLFSSGFLLLIGAMPSGFAVALAERYTLKSDWHSAMIPAIVMTVAVAALGGMFLCTYNVVSWRRGRARDSTPK